MNMHVNRLFGSFSKLSPNGILLGFFPLTRDIMRIQNQLSLLLFAICPTFFLNKMISREFFQKHKEIYQPQTFFKRILNS